MFKIRRLNLMKFYPLWVLIFLLSSAFLTCSLILNRSDDSLYISAAESSDRTVIILDAGHGGEDCGAIGVNGVYEKDLNLEITFMIGEELQKRGFAVVYTRTEDKLLYKPEEDIKGIRKISDLKNRCDIASRYPEALFISIHMNSFGQEKYSGTQVYASPSDGESRRLAESIRESVKRDVQQENKRLVKEGNDIYVLKNTKNTAVLIECGFLSNKQECEKLSQKEYQKQLSFSIVCGIIEYIGK